MSMKTKIGLALATTALGATLVGAGTFALFTSSAANTGNTFSAGTLTLQDVTGGVAVAATHYYSNLAPGDAENFTVKVKNNGSLDAWVKIDQAASNASKSGSLFGGATPLELTLDPDVVLVPAGGQATLDLGYNFPSAADNSYQSATGQFNVVVKAVQARNNTTGNGPTAW